ncbi:MAG: penicillin acylase family protein [Candidatus Dormibacteria bacterium]
MVSGRGRATVLALGALSALLFFGPVTAAAPQPAYRANDYGNMLNILPPGNNGLVTLADLAAHGGPNGTGARPAHSNDQYDLYQNLLYGYKGLTDSGLTNFYKDASFGVKPEDIDTSQTVTLAYPGHGNVTIYRDKQFGTPHVYGDTVEAMAYGAGYATGHDRLFLVDVLRYTGRGHLTELVGPSCGDESMDRSQLALTGYTQQDKQDQLDHIATLGPLGAEARRMISGEVQGINKYISDAMMNPTTMLPAEYPAVTGGPPGMWQDSDIIDIASLVGGIFGKGGGNEVAGGHLFQYLQAHFGTTAAQAMFRDFRQADDPNGPSTLQDKSFPYNVHDPGMLPTAKNAFTDPAAAVTDPFRAKEDGGCDTNTNNLVGGITGLLGLHGFSNALVVDAKHSTSGRPIAVFGPQVGYFAPQILMEIDLHAPDYDVRGASFPGTAFLVELGRGQDYAWSATSAGNDLVDQRIEVLCPTPPSDTDPKARYYISSGQCTKMDYHQDNENAISKAGGMTTCLPPCTIQHDIYRTHHALADAVVLGFTKTPEGVPVAISSQRSTYGHELDSAIGFLRWQHPSLVHDAASWMLGAADIGYTFNWLYADNRDIAYYDSGLDPVRQTDYNPDLPALGTGVAEWTGYLPPDQHPHEINPPSGYFVSWNNKQAPGFSASDAEFSYGPIYRSLSLELRVQAAFANPGKMSRATLASAMEDAASVDLTGAHVVPELQLLRSSITATLNPTDAAHATALLDRLNAWSLAGAHRVRAAHGDAQYADAPAVAIMDELNPRLIEALFDSVMTDPALGATVNHDTPGAATGFSKHPTSFADQPSAGLGSAYNGGWESYTLKVLRQLRGVEPGAPLSPSMTSRLCSTGLSACAAAIGAALAATYNQLASLNATGTVASWTGDTDTLNANPKTTIPANDAIRFKGVGLIGQPNMDWQNRPTFQQVVDFPSHRPRNSGTGPVAVAVGQPGPMLPPTSTQQSALLPALVLAAMGMILVPGLSVRRRRRGQ